MDGKSPSDKLANDVVRNLAGEGTALDVGFSGSAQLNGGKTNPQASEPAHNDNPCDILGEKSLVPGLRDEESEKIVEELQNCLPKWVTRLQILDMIKGFGGNVIEIVNNFYEHETEFCEQVPALISPSPTAVNRISLGIDVAPSSQLEFLKSISKRNGGSQLTQVAKFQRGNNSVKKSVSPIKGNRMVNSKSKKKAKASSKSESIDPKQAAITKFFTKISSNKAKG